AGGGVIGIFNRSVGPFERGRTDRGFMPSVTYLDPGAGAYRSPIVLPDGRILAGFAAGPVDLVNATSLPFKLTVVDVYGPTRGTQTNLGIAGESQVEPTLALAYPPRPFYLNQRQLVFGGSSGGDATHATIHLPDAPMVATLLGSNLRRGRHVEDFDVDALAVYGADGSMVGSAPLERDGSVRVRVPAATPLYLGLLKGQTTVFRMKEEHQVGPGESISLGIRRELFNNVCGGCHGSNSGREIDAAVRSDALTGASESVSRTANPVAIGPERGPRESARTPPLVWSAASAGSESPAAASSGTDRSGRRPADRRAWPAPASASCRSRTPSFRRTGQTPRTGSSSSRSSFFFLVKLRQRRLELAAGMGVGFPRRSVDARAVGLFRLHAPFQRAVHARRVEVRWHVVGKRPAQPRELGLRLRQEPRILVLHRQPVAGERILGVLGGELLEHLDASHGGDPSRTRERAQAYRRSRRWARSSSSGRVLRTWRGSIHARRATFTPYASPRK